MQQAEAFAARRGGPGCLRPLHRPQTRAVKRWRLQRGVRVAKTPSQRVSEEERRLPSPRPAGQRLSRPEAARPAPRSSGKVFSLRLPPWCRFALGGPGTGPLCGLCPPEKRPAVGVCFHLRARRLGREEMAAPSRAALRPRCHQLPVGACWQDHVCEFGIFFSPVLKKKERNLISINQQERCGGDGGLARPPGSGVLTNG